MISRLAFICSRLVQGHASKAQPKEIRGALTELELMGLATYRTDQGWRLTHRGMELRLATQSTTKSKGARS